MLVQIPDNLAFELSKYAIKTKLDTDKLVVDLLQEALQDLNGLTELDKAIASGLSEKVYSNASELLQDILGDDYVSNQENKSVQ